MAATPADALQLPEADRAFLEAHLPPAASGAAGLGRPFTTLTFATSLDSMLALRPGVRTALSGPQSKAMTHYLRSRHDAILIGVGTAVADDPGLNCRLEGAGGYGGEDLEKQPRPVIVDPDARWGFGAHSRLFRMVAEGKGKAPFILTTNRQPAASRVALLSALGGKHILVDMPEDAHGCRRLDWGAALQALHQEGIASVMIEGGAGIINSLLAPGYCSIIDAVILTIAPTWLGRSGVLVSPEDETDRSGAPIAAAWLTSVQWHPFGEDVVLCGKLKS